MAICGIYRIENNINKKNYIGQSIDIHQRWIEHKSNAFNNKISNKKYNYPLYAAFRKYGLNNFNFIILELCEEKFLDEREIYWIKNFNSYNDGYNLTLGGKGGYNPKKTSVQVLAYDLNGNFIKLFQSQSDISRELKIPVSNISFAIKNSIRCRNYIFMKKETDNYPLKIEPYIKKNQRPVEQIKNNKVIATYSGVREAERITGISHISDACNNFNLSAGGYKWRFANVG